MTRFPRLLHLSGTAAVVLVVARCAPSETHEVTAGAQESTGSSADEDSDSSKSQGDEDPSANSSGDESDADTTKGDDDDDEQGETPSESESDSSSADGDGESGPDDADDSGTDDPSESESDTGSTDDDCDASELGDLYERYIEPFVSGRVEQSCSQCHMTGIDLSLFAQDTPCATMQCMVERDMVDLSTPENSAVLAQILQGDPNSSVFDVEMEHQAFSQWIDWSASCHAQVCGDEPAGCGSGTGSDSTGKDPLGDCSEDDLLLSFWDNVIIDRGRCIDCHSTLGDQSQSSGDCTTDADCANPRHECIEGTCILGWAFDASNWLEGTVGDLSWDDPEDRAFALQSMYNVAALRLIDGEQPLDSLLLTKPLLEDFQPTAIYGDGIAIESILVGVGVGVEHEGTDKFTLGCSSPPCPDSGIIDCREEQPCGSDEACPESMACLAGHCRAPNSYCDETYVGYARFVTYFAECRGTSKITPPPHSRSAK